MTSYTARVLPLVALAAGLILGCAHRRGAGQGESAENPPPPPPPPPAPSPSTVTEEEIAQQSVMSLEQILAGRVAGVVVSRAPGGGISVVIRGPTSFLSSNEPLYVVDGAPVQPGPNGTLAWLNPTDIASIEVLKDAPSTAIYGVRGANGVIVIKLKGSHD